ncbi:hypothetical protein [Streptomyces erythrochromogenes]|uniref:hypothetical protein n=1 Tax=Streptomyces erythrochromogenes TaxID=285574 RepID=UPI0037017903
MGSAHNVFYQRPAPRGRAVGPLTAVLCLLLAAGAAVGGTLWWQSRDTDGGVDRARPPADTRPRPAPSGRPPVLLASVTGPVSDLPGRDFALPDALRMSEAELARFGSEIVPDSAAFASWYDRHGAVVTESGTITVALQGNAAEEVQITDINVHKKCGPPLDGTHFEGHSQGGGDTVAIGFDLDAADPYPRLRARTNAGLKWTERNYFDEQTLTLKPGERETLSVGVISARHRCSFTLELVVATRDGVLTQQVDLQGKPFELTARAPAAQGSRPPAGYRAAYVQDRDGWHPSDPAAAAAAAAATGVDR